MDDWKPTTSDIEWTKNLVKSLKIGGIWQTSFAVFKKIDENNFIVQNINLDPNVNAEENIDKVEKVLNILGIKLQRDKYDVIIASVLPNNMWAFGFKKKETKE
jgi:hypothetical protein